MSSINDYVFQNWDQTCIDDIITQYDSLSLSSTEIDNITLDSGIYFDSKSDILKQPVLSNVIPKEKLPPPPPPYNSNHNIISSVLNSSDLNMSFHNENIENSISNNNNNNSNPVQCSINDLLLNQQFQNQLSLSKNRFSLSRLLTEEQKHCNSTFENGPINNKLTESPTYTTTIPNQETVIGKLVDVSKFQQSGTTYNDGRLFRKLNTEFQCDLRNECKYDPISRDILNEEMKILGNCNKCQCLVTDSESACIALGNLYHSNCFICCHCSRSLRGKVFYKDQEKIYCENDYMVFGFHKSMKICDACGHIITETILEALGKDFHPRCFKCSICLKCLDGIPFTVDRNNNIYCILDYHNTFAPRCAVCLQPIIPCKDSDDVVRIVVNNRDFHVECYRCQNCLKLLSNESNCFVWTTDRSEANIKLLCRKCYVNQIRELSQLK